jgi:glycine/D-amino acid oxidase-like deaminating enzyme
VARAPLGAFDTGPALRFARQGQFHPLRYLSGLAKAVLAAGGQIYTGAHVEEFEGGAGAHVKTATGRKVACKAVVVATNTPVNDRVVIHTKQAPYRTYVVGVEIPAGSVEKALFWDTGDPYHYVRTQGQEGGRPDLLIVGGEDHRTGQADDAGSAGRVSSVGRASGSPWPRPRPTGGRARCSSPRTASPS